MTPVRLELAGPGSDVKHSTTEPLRSYPLHVDSDLVLHCLPLSHMMYTRFICIN